MQEMHRLRTSTRSVMERALRDDRRNCRCCARNSAVKRSSNAAKAQQSALVAAAGSRRDRCQHEQQQQQQQKRARLLRLPPPPPAFVRQRDRHLTRSVDRLVGACMRLPVCVGGCLCTRERTSHGRLLTMLASINLSLCVAQQGTSSLLCTHTNASVCICARECLAATAHSLTRSSVQQQ